MGRAVKIGDVFLVPIDETRVAMGQVAGDWNGELYLVIYDGVHVADKCEAAEIVKERPLFAALSLDAKLHNGDWPIIGNILDNVPEIPQPVFKINHGSELFVISRDRLTFRPASENEAAFLRLRKVVAPVRLEKALKAHNGVGDWNAAYDELFADYAEKSARFVD